RRVTASKIAGIMDCDPWGGTPWIMWHQLAGHFDAPEADTEATRRGRHLEAGVADWWAEDNPEWTVTTCGTFQSRRWTWAYATPDRLLATTSRVALMEIKTQADTSGWGTPETNGVPLHYWLQGLWQCAVTGLRDVVFVVLGPFLELTEYWVTYTDFDIEMTVDTIGEFVATLPGGVCEREPERTNPSSEWPVLAAMTPATVQAVEVGDVYFEYAAAKLREKEAAAELDAARSRVIVAGVDGECITADGRVVATRSGDRWRFKPVPKQWQR
ncbi:YqaJ viral recombinase family protein, partial [Clostridioides difficile]